MPQYRSVADREADHAAGREDYISRMAGRELAHAIFWRHARRWLHMLAVVAMAAIAAAVSQ